MVGKKSDLAIAMDAVQAGLQPLLKASGFRVRGRTFNRLTPDGLTQVLNLQMGSFDPPGTTSIPGLRVNLYGKFTVNLGVHVPEVSMFAGTGKPATFVQAYDCFVRARLGLVGPERKDLWWEVRQAGLMPELTGRVEGDAFPFLARFECRDSILNEWLRLSKNPYVGNPPRIVCAVILAARGQHAEAQELLVRQLSESSHHRGHEEYVRELARRLGLGPLDV